MGLGKYRPYKDEFHDEGYEKRVVPADFVPVSITETQFKYGT
jgi:hypothetical protein